jgi:hypothetical protein
MIKLLPSMTEKKESRTQRPSSRNSYQSIDDDKKTEVSSLLERSKTSHPKPRKSLQHGPPHFRSSFLRRNSASAQAAPTRVRTGASPPPSQTPARWACGAGSASRGCWRRCSSTSAGMSCVSGERARWWSCWRWSGEKRWGRRRCGGGGERCLWSCGGG